MSLSNSIRKDLLFFVLQSGKHIKTAANLISPFSDMGGNYPH